MNVDSVQQFCLSFPAAKESLQWGETLCFKVRGKIFAMLGLDSVPPSLCVKCSPEKFEELMELDGIVIAPYVGRYKWVLLERLNALPADDLKEVIGASYAMVAAKAPKARTRRASKRKKIAKRAQKPAKPGSP